MAKKVKLVAILLVCVTVTLLISCAVKPGLEAAPAAGSATAEPLPSYEPFTGDTKGYTCRYPIQSRDWEWEMDILQIAGRYLGSHPFLTEGTVKFLTAEDELNYIRTEHYKVSSLGSVADAQLRAGFIQAVEALIQAVPISDDNHIIFRMVEIVAMLGDAHSRVTVPEGDRFPLVFEEFADGLFIISAPKELEWALGCRLLEINGVPAGEIAARLAPMTKADATGVAYRLGNPYALRYIDVIGADEPDNALKAVFTVMDAAGEERVFEMKALTIDERDEAELVTLELALDLRLNTDRDPQYFYEYFPEDDLLYVRFRRFGNSGQTFHEIEGYTIAEMTDDINEKAASLGGVKRFAVDLRGNRGGVFSKGLLKLIESLAENRGMFGKIYVMIDGGVFSMGVVAATFLKTQVEDVILIGEPAGQPPNMPLTNGSATARFSRVKYSFTSEWYNMWPGYEQDLLMPDIHIPRLFSDVSNNMDAALDYIRSNGD